MDAPRYIDSHCHIHDERIPDGPDGAVAAATEMGVDILVTVGSTLYIVEGNCGGG